MNPEDARSVEWWQSVAEAKQEDRDAARKEADELRQRLHDQIEYVETVDSLLDGTIPTTRTAEDGTVAKLWLKERVQLLLDQLESTADKLSDCWLMLDALARSQPTDLASSARVNAARELLTRQKCPGWTNTKENP